MKKIKEKSNYFNLAIVLYCIYMYIYNIIITQKDKTMKIERKNNRLETKGGFLNYTVEDYEITLDLVCVNISRQGIGSALVNELKDIASDLNLPIGLYAEPNSCSDTVISECDLINFYEKLGFVKDTDDVDGKLLIWE